MDAVQAANSGHPGHADGAGAGGLLPVAASSCASTPQDPIWPNRDRFVLSGGPRLDAAVLAAAPDRRARRSTRSTRSLGEPSVTLDDIKTFRQLDSRCPGHPEYRWTTGVETTTGPLGQGVATSVGMAIAGRWLAARYNQPGFDDCSTSTSTPCAATAT